MKTRIFGEPQRLLEDLIEYFSRAKQNPIVCRLRKCCGVSVGGYLDGW